MNALKNYLFNPYYIPIDRTKLKREGIVILAFGFNLYIATAFLIPISFIVQLLSAWIGFMLLLIGTIAFKVSQSPFKKRAALNYRLRMGQVTVFILLLWAFYIVFFSGLPEMHRIYGGLGSLVAIIMVAFWNLTQLKKFQRLENEEMKVEKSTNKKSIFSLPNIILFPNVKSPRKRKQLFILLVIIYLSLFPFFYMALAKVNENSIWRDISKISITVGLFLFILLYRLNVKWKKKS